MFVFGVLLVPSYDKVYASEGLTGTLTISYSYTSGTLTATYSGDCTLSSSALFTFYKDSSSAQSTTSSTYTPSAAATYYCKLTDTSEYSGSITSGTITLYKASSSSTVSFDNTYGLYEAGDTVTASVSLSSTQQISNWTTNVSGVAIAQTNNPVTFTMPASNITITPTIQNIYSIKVYGGTADIYSAPSGTTITLTASSVDGMTFSGWSATSGSITDKTSPVTTYTVGSSNAVITATFIDSATGVETTTGEANAVNAVYTVLDNGGYTITVKHHSQGPLADATFKAAQGNDWLVTDYFNITVNNSLSTYSTANNVRIKLTIPDDLIKNGRNWRMICVSENGSVYTFADEDSDDSTITFTTNRFYAYAMAYNDNVNIVSSSDESTDTSGAASSTVSATVPSASSNTSQVKTVSESQTSTSTVKSADESQINGNGESTNEESISKIKSNQKSAIKQADGTSIPNYNL